MRQKGSNVEKQAWAVHCFTASGALAGLMACTAIVNHDPRAAFLWMLLATFIDGIDGTFARRVDVVKNCPQVDGRRLDDMVDYFTWVVTPVLAMAWWGILPGWPLLWGMPLVASALGMARCDAKTDDDFFRGFPSLWNIVAFYLWHYQLPTDIAAGLVATLSITVLAPLKFVYPTRTRTLRNVTLAMMTLWGLHSLFALLWDAWSGMLIYPFYYVGLSAYLQIRKDKAPDEGSGLR